MLERRSMPETPSLAASVLAASGRLDDGLSNRPREQFQRLAAPGVDLVVTMTLSGVIGFVSPLCRTLLDCEPASLVGTRFHDLVHAEDMARVRFEDLFARRTVGRREVFRCRRGDGAFIWIEADFRRIGDPVSDSAGEVLGVLRDITERRAADDRLNESEERFRGSFEAAAHGIALVSTSGRWLEVNRALCDIVGYSEKELLATDFQTLTHPDDLDKDLHYVEQLISGQIKNYKMEKRYFHKFGQIVWVLLSVSLVRDAQGRPVHFVSQVLDITASREAERALREAKEAAERTNSLKTAFLATMSHEIRTPMNGVLGFADILLRTQLTTEQRRALTLLRDAGTSLLAIINDILDLSKIEAGKMRLEAEPIHLVDLVEGAVSILGSQASAKALDLRVEIEGTLPVWVEADPVRLRQVILNLLSNAIKFTDRGHVALNVRRCPDRPDILFEVEDTGIGLSRDSADQLFEEFTQLDRSMTRRYGGTGLGLAICKRLVEAMPNGRIGVASEPGCGSRFWFAAALPAAAARATRDAVTPPVRCGESHPRRILLAEDNYINQVVVEQMLSDAGHKVIIVGDGRAAVEAVAAQDFDLVVMDMEMPVMDGISATRRIRAMAEPASSLPIVALTANAMPQEVARCAAAGMNGHLSKPVDRETLVRAVAEWARPMQAPTRGESAAVDMAVVADLEASVGRHKHIELLGKFRDQLVRSSAVMAGSNVEAIGREAHILVSAAGFLGFKELMQCSRSLMTAIDRRTDDVASSIAACRTAVAHAGEIIDAKCGPALPEQA